MKNIETLNICQKCGAQCCKKVGGPNMTKKEAQRIIDAGYPKLFVKHSVNHYEIKSKKGNCLYLAKDNSCSIHEARPEICRWWPVDYALNDKDKVELFLMECPLTKYTSKKFIRDTKKQLKKLPKKTILEFYSDTCLSDSEMSLIAKGQARFKHKKLK